MSGLNTAARNNRIDFVTTQFDAGASGGLLDFYTAPRPATGATPTGATKLATCTLSATSFPAAASGTATANAVTGDTAVDAGTVVWCRGTDSDGNFVEDYSVGTSGAEVIVNAVVLEQDAPLDVDSFVRTAGNA